MLVLLFIHVGESQATAEDRMKRENEEGHHFRSRNGLVCLKLSSLCSVIPVPFAKSVLFSIWKQIMNLSSLLKSTIKPSKSLTL